RDMLETLRGCLGLTNRITATSNGRGGHYHTLQWSDRAFYLWLMDVGLTPAKSLTLAALSIPDEYFPDFFRGCIDGDGSIRVYTDRYHASKCERYVYERLYVSIVSASGTFLHWLQATVAPLARVTASLTGRRKRGCHPLWKLSYAKADSIRLIRWMYYAPIVPCLDRKRATAARFLSPLGFAHAPAGRPRVGWIYDEPRVKESNAAWFLSAPDARILSWGRGGAGESRLTGETVDIPPHGGRLIDRVLRGDALTDARERAPSLKRISFNARMMSDLELLAVGAYSPLEGFMGEADYRVVLRDMRLASGLRWTLPITLAVRRAAADELREGE